MSQQTINVGSGELTGDGESIRSAFQKVNSNFTEIYTTGFGAGPTGPSGPAGPTGPQGGDFIENKSFFVDFNGTDTNDGRSRGYPLKTITRALSSATTGTTVFISPGIFIESYPMTVPKGVTVKGSGLRATTISPTTATNSNDGFLVDGETTLSDFNMTGQYWNTGTNTGYAIRVKSSATFTTRSPYLERITILNRGTVSSATDVYGFASGDAGRGVLIDGADINSNSVEAALLFNEFTMIVPGSIGFHLKNGARVEMLTSFTYFADKAIWAESGTVGRYTTGKTRLRASGYNLGSITTGTVISQYNSTGTLLATGNIASFVQGQNLILLNGKVPGFQEYDPEAPGKTVNLVGNATYSTADYKFGVSSLKFDNNLGDVASTGYVSVSGGGDFNFLDNDATFELFFKPLSYGEDQHLLSTERYDIIYTFDRKIKFNYKDTYGNSVATLEQTGPYTTGSWHFVSVSRQNDQVYLHVNGTRNGIPAVNITGDFIGNPIYLGTRYSTFTYGFKGYIDNVRITKSVGRYNNDYAVTTSTLTADTNTVLMLEETAASGVKIIDNAVPKQNITFSTTATADYLTLVDYKEFGAEVRAIACANVYGNHGVYADGLGNLITLMSHNFSYVGSGANLENDPDLVNQANEVVAVNGAQVFYNTIDQGGDVRIGDFFKADQQRGRLTFNADELNLYGLTNISFNTNGGIIFGDGSVQTTSGTKSFSSILFVDPSGNNTTANGSMALPFQTIQAAHDYAQNSAESNISTTTHLIIQVNPGNYYENITISRPRTHLIGLAEGFSLATSIYGQITFLSTSTIPFNLNTYSLQGMNLVNTGTYGIRLTGSRGYRFFGKNLNQTGYGSQSSALYADPTLPIRITLDDSTFYNFGSTSTQFDLRNSYNCVFNNITTFVNSSTFLNQRNSTIYIKNSEINCTENSLLAADVISGSLTIDNSVINVANSTATGIFVHSTSTVQLFNTRLLVGNTTGTLLAVDGLAGGSIITQNLIFSTATNIGISTSLSHTKYVAADSVHQHILPAADLTYDLGSTSSQWRSLYVGTSTIYLGGTALSVSGGNLTVDGSPVAGSGGLGDFKIYSSAGGSTLGTVDNPNTGGWGGYDIYIDSGGNLGSNAKIYIPSVANQAAGTSLQIVNNGTATSIIQLFGRGGIQLVTNTGVNEKIFEFADNGDLIIPNAILGSGDQAVVIQNTASGVAYLQLPVDPSADSVILANQAVSSATVTIRVGDFGNARDWTFNEFGGLATPGFIYNNDPSNVGQLLLQGDVGESATYLALPSDVGSTTTNVRLANQNGDVQLYAGNSTWLFNNTGELALPNGSMLFESSFIAASGTNAVLSQFDSNTQIYTMDYAVGVQTHNSGTYHTWLFNNTGGLELPGGSTLATSGYDVALIAGNDGTSTFGTVTISTQYPPDLTDRNWAFNSLGEFYLPLGGAIQETVVTNELWGTTTTSLTLVPAGAANGTQRLEIYSTGGGEGDHIHITSGDQNQTDLFLGNDTQYYAVAASGANYIQARNGAASPGPGTSAGPGANVNIYAGNAGDNGGNVADGNSGGDVFISSGISSSGLGGDILINTSSGPDGFGSIELSTDGGSSIWTFNKDNELVFPGGGDIVFDSSATSYIYGVTGIEFADATIQTTAFTGTSALLDITNTNGLTTPYYLTFVENRTAGQEVRADVDLVYDCADNLLRTGAFSATNYITVGGILNTNRGVHEKFTTATTASSVVSYDCATTQLFYHATTGTVANWTANFTNLSLEAGRATTVNIIINQGNTGYYPSAVQIGGAAQTLNWQGNTTPSVSANRTDVVTFSILNNSGSYIVLGQLTGF